MKNIYAFDFDGTLTKRDSLIAFLLFAKGWKEFLKCFALHIHLLIAMKLKLADSGKVKESIFAYYFQNMPESMFDNLCERFAATHSHILRPKGVERVREAMAEPDSTVMIVSASINNWVAPFFRDFPGIEIFCTRIEVKEGNLTGRFLSANCRGKEKVRRILVLHPDRKSYFLTAFGDSSGDIAMLDFADEGFYKPFR